MKGFWAQFQRLHLGAMFGHRVAVISAVIGVAIGASLVIATQLLTTSLIAPFEAVPEAFASSDLIEVRPVVADRLSADFLEEVSQTAGVAASAQLALLPTVATVAQTQGSGSREVPLLLVGVEDPEKILGDAELTMVEARSDDVAECNESEASSLTGRERGGEYSLPVVGSIVVLEAADEALGGVGCVTIGGSAVGVAAKATSSDSAINSLQGGQVAFAGPGMFGASANGEYWSLGYLRTTGDRSELISRLEEKFEGRATFGDPSPSIPPAIITVRDALSSLGAGGIFIGALIAFNTLVLVIGERLSSLATAIALGTTRRKVLAGVAAEGAVIGAVGGLVAIPLGLLLAKFLVGEFGASILAGSGLEIALKIDSIVLAGAPTTGAIIGALATWFAARKPLKSPLLLIGGAVDRVAVGRVPRWLAPVGVLLVLVGTALAQGVGAGSVPVKASQAALIWGAIGVTLLATSVIPTIARWLLRLREGSDPASARILRSEINRVPVRIAMIVCTVGLASGMATAFAGLSELAPATLERSFNEHIGAEGRLASPQLPWDPRFGSIADPSQSQMVGTGRDGTEPPLLLRSRSLIPSDTEPRLALGIAAVPEAVEMFVDADDSTKVANQLLDGQVALTKLAATRLGVSEGDTVTLPTVEGAHEFTVAQLVEVGIADDSTIGDWVIADEPVANRWWGTVPSILGSRGEFTVPTGLHRFNATEYAAATKAGIGRYFEPFALTGWVYLVAAVLAVSNFMILALVARRRDRAVLSVIGADSGTDRRAVLSQAVLQALLATAVMAISLVAFTFWLALSSPAFYGFRLDFGIAAMPLLIGLSVMLLGLCAAAIRPWFAAATTSVQPAIRGE